MGFNLIDGQMILACPLLIEVGSGADKCQCNRKYICFEITQSEEIEKIIVYFVKMIYVRSAHNT